MFENFRFGVDFIPAVAQLGDQEFFEQTVASQDFERCPFALNGQPDA